MKTLCFFGMVLSLLFFRDISWAQITLAHWTFENTPTAVLTLPYAADDPTPYPSAVASTEVDLFGAPNNNGTPTPCVGESWGTNDWDPSATIITADYMQFTITASATEGFEVESFSFTVNITSTNAARDYQVDYSDEGSAFSTILSGNDIAVTTCLSQSHTFGTPVTISPGGNIRFRIYFWDQGAAGIGGTVRVDDIEINGTILPVEWSSFSLKERVNGVDMFWSTQQEINSDYFIVEKSGDGIRYIDIAKIKGAGNSNLLNQYHYFDNNPYPGINYYRIKQVDFDGSFYYSSIKVIELDQSLKASISPNPVDEEINVLGALSSNNLDHLSFQIWSIRGDLYKYGQFDGHSIEVNDCAPGIYFLKILDHSRATIFSERFIKN